MYVYMHVHVIQSPSPMFGWRSAASVSASLMSSATALLLMMPSSPLSKLQGNRSIPGNHTTHEHWVMFIILALLYCIQSMQQHQHVPSPFPLSQSFTTVATIPSFPYHFPVSPFFSRGTLR